MVAPISRTVARYGRVRDYKARLTIGFRLIVALEVGDTGAQPAIAAIIAGMPTRLMARRRL